LLYSNNTINNILSDNYQRISPAGHGNALTYNQKKNPEK
jgi:hypothetical protein